MSARPQRYQFANQIWTEIFISDSSYLNTLIRMAVYASIPWLFGFFYSYYYDIHGIYLETPAFYYGFIGILATTIGVTIGARIQYGIYDEITKCFIRDPKDQIDYIKLCLEQNSRFREHLYTSFATFIVMFGITAFSFLHWDIIEPISSFIGTQLPRFESFNTYGWYNDAKAFHGFLIVFVFSIFISASLGTATPLIIRMPIFLYHLTKRQPQLPPKLIKIHFSRVSKFFVTISLLWSFGVLLIYGFAIQNDDWLTTLIIIVYAALGVINFLVPQLTYLHSVRKSEVSILSAMSTYFEASPFSDSIEKMRDGQISGLQHLPEKESLLTLMQHDRVVYPLHQAYLVVIVYLVSVIGLEGKIVEALTGG